MNDPTAPRQSETGRPEDAARARRVRRLQLAFIGCAVLFVAVTFLWWHPHREPYRALQECRSNLGGLGVLLTNWRLHPQQGRDVNPHNGPAALLWFRKQREIRMGEEEYLLCPVDPLARFPDSDEDRAVYDAIDPADPASWPPGCLSYAVRDFVRFPLSREPGASEIVACCRCGPDGTTPHHEDGVPVVFSDTFNGFLDWNDLGFPETGPPAGTVIVGPGSPNPELAKLIVPR